MADDGAASCVYVTQALLDALERDKRALKWQLARATKAADEHATQRVACEAKVKDLMTIVEMNKSVAHKAVQRNYTKESVLQRLHQERARLQTQVETLRRRGVDTLERRSTQRRQREAFHTWSHETTVRCKRRRAIRRMLQNWRRRWIHETFATWRCRCRPADGTKLSRSAVVCPISAPSFTYGNPHKMLSVVPQPPHVRFALSPASSVRSDSTTMSSSVFGHAYNACKSLSFATWKAQWLTRKRHYTTASHFARLMMVKRVLTAWKHVVRRRNWRESMITSAAQRRQYRCFMSWVSWTTLRRRRRFLVSRIVQRTARRRLRHAFVHLRIKCLEKCMAEWTEVLKDARRALDEEQKMYAHHQSEAMREIEQKASHQQSKLASLVDAQLNAMAKKQRLTVLIKYIATWQRHLAHRKMQTRLADQHHRCRRRRRHMHRIISIWRAAARQRRAVKRFQKRRCSLEDRVRLTATFTAFVRTVKCLVLRKRSLQRILCRRRLMDSSRTFWKWRGAIRLADEQANAQLERRQLLDRLEIRDATSRCEAQRLRRVGYKYQLQCALALGDIQLERRKRLVFVAWKMKVVHICKRRTVLSKLVRRKTRLLLKLAAHRWWELSDDRNTLLLALKERESTRDKKIIMRVFNAWRASFHREMSLTAQGSLQFLTLLLWRKRSHRQHARNAALSVLLKHHSRYRWKKPAFEKWRRRIDQVVGLESRQNERRQALLRRSFQSWSIWFTRRSRSKKLQLKKITARAEWQAMLRLLAAVWVAWRDQARQRKVLTRVMSLSQSKLSKLKRVLILERAWQSWTSMTLNCKAKRAVLTRVFRRHSTRTIIDAWRRWEVSVERDNGIRTGQALLKRKMQRVARAHHEQRELRRLLSNWIHITRVMKRRRVLSERQFQQHHVRLLERRFWQWRSHFVPLMHFRRLLLRLVVARQQRTLLRLGMQKWKLEAQQGAVSQDHQQLFALSLKVRSQALVFHRRAWATRYLRAYFVAWRSYWRRLIMLKRLLKRVVSKKAAQSVRVAWGRWTTSTAIHESLRQVSDIWIRNVLRLAWYQLHTKVQAIGDQEGGARRLLCAFSIAVRRCAWNQWKRRDQALLVSRITITSTVSRAQFRAFKNHVGLRHSTRSQLARVFGKWRIHTSQQQSVRGRVVRFLTRQDSLRVKRSFHSWALHVANHRHALCLLVKLMVRRSIAMQRDAFLRWCSFGTKIMYNTKLVDTQRQLTALREVLARRVAMDLRKPTMAAVLGGWKCAVDRQKRAISELLARQIHRRVKMMWMVWQEEVTHRKAVHSGLVALLRRKQRCTIAIAWRLWVESMQWKETAHVALQRVLASRRIRFLRFGWRSLRLHMDMVMRNHYKMAVVSVQQQLSRQKQLHQLRGKVFLLQRHRHRRLRERFVLWKDYLASRTELKTRLLATSKRYHRRARRAVLLAWWSVTVQVRTRARRIDKWQQTQCRMRMVRFVWRSWIGFTATRLQAQMAMQSLLASRAKRSLLTSWTVWQKAVEEEAEVERLNEIAHWRCAATIQENQVASLEANAKGMLLESIRLKQALQTQRERCAEALVKKIGQVCDAVWTRNAMMCWTRWVYMTDRLQAAWWLVGRFAASRMREAFVDWRQAAQLCKYRQHEKTTRKKIARILTLSTLLMHKKNAWWQWTEFVKRRRAKRVQRRVADVVRHRRGDRAILCSVFVGWKTAVRGRKHSQDVALRVMKTVNHKRLRTVFGAWTRWREKERSKREAIIVLCRIARTTQRRNVQHHWLKWRLHMAESAVLMAKSLVMLKEIEASEQEERSVGQTISLRVFTAWRETVTQRRRNRTVCYTQQQAFDALWTKRNALHGWRELVHVAKLKEARKKLPVLCIRTNVHERHKQADGKLTNAVRGAVLSFANYTRHRHHVHWRVHISRRVTQTRLRRACGLAWILRSLRRHHLRIQRRALWRWFATIQPISCALQAVSFAELPWRRADVDFAGSMLLLTLEELDLATQTHRNENIQRSWCVVESIARSIQRDATRRAFDRWRWSRQQRLASAYGSMAKRRFAEHSKVNSIRARARAWIAQLKRVTLRRAFDEWKSQYVASAIEQAQADYDALQEALAQTTRHRRVRDAQAY